jgi:crotonobetainyl-CoA:carnitine CoA-transferase CaiB-like acyl-CoA transferase
LVGTDFLVQAFSGLGDGLSPEGEPSRPSRMVLCDLFGGLVAAEGILAALFRREEAGGAWEVRSSLLAGAMSLQAHVLDDLRRGKEVGRRCGRPVWGPLDRPLPTGRGSLVVSAEDDEAFGRLCGVVGLDPTAAARTATEAAVAARLLDGAASEWEERLTGVGVAAAVVCEDLPALPGDPRLAALFEPVATGFAPRSPWQFG